MKKIFLLLCFTLCLCSCSVNAPPQTVPKETVCLKEKYAKELKEKTFILGGNLEHLICFNEFEDNNPYINNIYNFRESVSDEDTLFFEHNISTLGLYFVGLNPSENQRCKTQIIKYNKNTKEKEIILKSPNIPVKHFNTVAPYLGGYCTGEISADSNGNIIDSIVSQYDIKSKSYNYYTLNSEDMPTVCGFDESTILALNFNSSENSVVSNITLINTNEKEQKTILSKTLNNDEHNGSGTFIWDICSSNQFIFTLEDEQTSGYSKLFIRVYNLKGYLLQEFKLDSNKIGSPSFVGNTDLCIAKDKASIKTNYGYYILSPNRKPYKISSINNNSGKLFFAGKSGDYFVYYEENPNSDENGEIVLHVIDTNTYINQAYYLVYDNTCYSPTSINITAENTLVAQLKKISEQTPSPCSTCYYYINNFI